MAEAHTPTTKSIADQVSAILEQSAREPGINEMLALMRMSEEVVRIQHIQADMVPPAIVIQATGTHFPSVR